MDNKKGSVIFSANRGFGLTRSRSELIKRYIDSGYSVIAAVKEDQFTNKLRELGAVIEGIDYERGGLSVWKDLRVFIRLLKLYITSRPSLVHHYHTKPVLLGTLAARLAGGIKVVNTLTGLGYAFSRNVLIRYLATTGYWLILRQADVTVFQNPDDRELFVQKNLVPRDKTEVIISAGVDTNKFAPNSKDPNSFRVLMVSRLLWQKGVREYVKAVNTIRDDFPKVEFLLAGEIDENHPNAINRAWIDEVENKYGVVYIGYVEDMVSELQRTDIFVLPSYYREGVPRVLLEASSCGVPVITTDMPGCKEAVIDGETGILVEPRNVQSLARAMKNLIINNEKRKLMGKSARRLAKNKFKKENVIEQYLEVYKDFGIDL